MTGYVMPGGFGSRNGAQWSTAWADHRLRSERGRAAHGTASVQHTVTPPSRNALRRAIAANLCPYCGKGPYKNLGMHTNRAHGVSAAELRDMSGLKRVCSEELSDDSRSRFIQRPDREEITRKATAASVKAGAQQIALAASLAPRVAQMEARDPTVVQRALRGDRLVDIAADIGVTSATVGRILRRHGVQPTLSRTNAERRERLGALRVRATASNQERIDAERSMRVRRFHELGGDWKAVESLADECQVDEKNMRAYLRRVGVTVPDGRVVSRRRRMKVTPEQTAEIRRLALAGLTQSQVGERFGISQSRVSSIVRAGEAP